MHCGKKTSQWRECDALYNILRMTLGPAIHVDISLIRATYLNMVADQVHPFMVTVFRGGGGLSQKDNAPCHTAQEWVRVHDVEFKASPGPPNSSDLNPFVHLWNVLGQQVQGGSTSQHTGLTGSAAILVPDTTGYLSLGGSEPFWLHAEVHQHIQQVIMFWLIGVYKHVCTHTDSHSPTHI